jgi:hypothetical protein
VARFLDPLMYVRTGKKCSGRPVYRLIERFRFDYSELSDGPTSEYIIYVHSGFETDLCSTPRVVWSLIPPWIGEEAGVIHDWLYRKGEVDRRVADAIYRQALKVLGIGATRRMLMWLAVRLFGSHSYKRMGAMETFVA